jgi:hypothetical protein
MNGGQVDDDGFRQGGCERLTQGSAGVVGPDRRQVEPRHRGMRLARLVSFQNGDARAAFEGEMRAGDVDWRMHIYGGVQHSFTHRHADRAGTPGLAYDPVAADRAGGPCSTCSTRSSGPTALHLIPEPRVHRTCRIP